MSVRARTTSLPALCERAVYTLRWNRDLAERRAALSPRMPPFPVYPRATRRPLVAALRAARRPAQCLPPPAPVSPSCCALCPPSARPPLARVRLPHSPRAVAEGAYGASAPARRLLGASSAAAALTAPSPSCHVALFLSSGRAARSVPPHACDRLHCGGGEAPPSLPAPRHAHRARAACVLFRGRGPRAARPPARPLS